MTYIRFIYDSYNWWLRESYALYTFSVWLIQLTIGETRVPPLCVPSALVMAAWSPPTVSLRDTRTIFRLLMAICARFDLKTHQFDAVNAFTNSTLDETIYCHMPKGF